jgi:hypothetical protein
MEASKPTEDQIRLRAFELWDVRGRPEGYANEFWTQAERELCGAQGGQSGSPNAAGATSGGGSDGPG